MITIVEQFKQWQSALDDFQTNMKSDLAEIRQQKSEVLQIKKELLELLDQGKFIRDENRIVISAPEIIIGNVDKSGILENAASRVILRAGEVSLEGVGLGEESIGSVVSRASSIRHIAVDPGVDGNESVVKEVSEVVSQAHGVTLYADSSEGFFSELAGGTKGGILLHTDGYIDMQAALPCESRSKKLSNEKSALKSQISEQKELVKTYKQDVETAMKELYKLMSNDVMNMDDIMTRMNFTDIDEFHGEFECNTSALYAAMTHYFDSLSCLAEMNRQLDQIEGQEKTVSCYKSKYEKESNGCSILMRSERIDMISVDGDGNLRTDADAGIGLLANKVDIRANQGDESLFEEGEVNISAKTVQITTTDPKVEEDKVDYPAVGDVRIVSKNIVLESVDYELKDEKIQEKALTAEGSIQVRAESIAWAATDTEGKATGRLTANAKAVEIKTTDTDKEKGTDSAVASGSTLLLLSEKVFAGAKDKNLKSKLLQLSSDSVGTFADTTIELQQDGKSILQLSGGNASLSGGSTIIYGETTLHGATTFKSDVTAGTVDMKNLKVQTSFKTPYTTESVAVPSPPSTSKLSTKLKEEEIKSSN